MGSICIESPFRVRHIVNMSHYRLLYFHISLLIIVITGGYSIAEAPTTLRLAHVVFRHGDRSPTQTFPNDPHQENSWPQGFGQLTQVGMRQEHELGKVLRSLYNGFLNDTYIRREIYVRSTDKDRTLMSAYTCLAGLYPPHGAQVWNDSIHWQPIPVHTVSFQTDNVDLSWFPYNPCFTPNTWVSQLLRAGTPCDRYMPMMYKAFDSEEVHQYSQQNKMLSVTDTVCDRYAVLLDKVYISPQASAYQSKNKLLSESDSLCRRYALMLSELYQSELVLTYQLYNQDFLNMVRKESGLGAAASLYDVMEKVPNPLLCEKIHNLTLPQWVTSEVFDKLQDLKNFQIKLWFYTREMQRIRAGVLLNDIVNHTRAKVAGQLDSQFKMYLYSAHDTSIAAAMMALDTWDGLLPAYSATMMFELHQRLDESYFVRLLYKNDSTIDPASEPVRLSIRGCELDCDLDKFYKVIQPMLYEGDWFKECANLDTSPHHSTSTVVIGVAVCVVLLAITAMIVTCLCYRKKSGGISYQSANFSADTASA